MKMHKREYPIIAIFGQKNNGKTTLARMIANELSGLMCKANIDHPEFQIVGFADPLKAIMSLISGMTIDDIDAWKNSIDEHPNHLNITVREGLQKIGQLGRDIYTDCWVDLCMNIPAPLIIHDGRHFNEFDACKAYYTETIFISREGFCNDDPHPSEQQALQLFVKMSQQFSHIVDNKGTLEDLEKRAKGITQKIFVRFFKTQMEERLNNA